MSGWHKGPMLALDFETCGLPAWDTAAVQIGLARLNYPGETGAVCHTWLVNPERPIHPEASKVHGITDEIAQRDGKPYRETLAEVGAAVTDHLRHGWPLICFNASFDCTLLEAELTRLELPTVVGALGRFAPVIDPFVLDKQLSRRKGSRRLEDQCAHYDVRIDGAHDAGADALAAARVAWRIASSTAAIAEADPFDLHLEQVNWHQEQRDSLRAYFDRTGKAHDGVDPRWPLQLPRAGAGVSGLCLVCDQPGCQSSNHATSRPGYIYVASSWRNPIYPAVVAALAAAGLPHYDFRNPVDGAGFGWEQVGGQAFSDGESIETYLQLIEHPIAIAGFDSDFTAMNKADTFVLVLPCGRSAHLELGWAVGQGKRTAILLEEPCTPELMYRMVDHLAPDMGSLLGWLGVEQ